MPTLDLSSLARRLTLAAAVALCASAALAQYSPDPNSGIGSSDSGSGPDVSASTGRVRAQVGAGGRLEWIVIGPSGQAEAVRRAIEAAGGEVTRSTVQGALGQTSQIAHFQNESQRLAAEEAIARLPGGTVVAWNHLYGFAQSARTPRLYAPTLIGDAAPGHCRLTRAVTIGMIDGPVNADHPALRGVSVTVESLVTRARLPGADHGTAVAVLMVGQDPSGALAGFAAGARLHAISVFAEDDQGEAASVERIAQAIDRLTASGVRLINLSLAGPENAALGLAIRAAAARGVVLVGASGNEGRRVVAWPAAAPEVIAVTAIDARRRRFNLANTGPEIEFAAPGVDVYAARARGAGYVSGTSFAAPIVTALAARQMARGATSAEAIRAALRRQVEGLGQGGRNADFGWGLVRSGGC